MTPHAIVSYDDTDNDRDALTLGRILREAGARLTLAYVRHCVHLCPDDEELSHHEAHALLERGAGRLGEPHIPRRVVMNASTGDGQPIMPLPGPTSPPSESSAAPPTRRPSRRPSPSPRTSTPRWSTATVPSTCSWWVRGPRPGPAE
jgi:hypothetical protein